MDFEQIMKLLKRCFELKQEVITCLDLNRLNEIEKEIDIITLQLKENHDKVNMDVSSIKPEENKPNKDNISVFKMKGSQNVH